MAEKKIFVLFDGICNLCSGAVKFILKRDRKGKFMFASLQSESAEKLLKKYGINENVPDTIILIEQNKIYLKSSAVLRIIKRLDGAWPLCYGFIIFPGIFRDCVYDWIARNRFRWFGRKTQCYLPEKKNDERFF